MKRLHRLWRRAVYCHHGQHRETVACTFGIMHFECVDCGLRRMLGFVFHASNKLHPHWPWERPDDA